MSLKNHPVVIIGAGPAGLVTSLLLSNYQVHHILVDQNFSIDQHPQAHFINYRSMEVLREIDDLDQLIAAEQTSLNNWRRFVYCTQWIRLPRLKRIHITAENGLLGCVDHFADNPYDSDSPARVAHLSQNKLMVHLLDRARRSEFASIMQGYRAGVEEYEDRSSVILFNRETGRRSVLNPDFVVCADGARSTTRQQLNIDQTHQQQLQYLINVHFFSRPLANELRSRIPAMLYFTYSAAGVAVLVAHALDQGEFVLQVPYYPPHQQISRFANERCVRLIQELAGRPIEVNIQSIRSWIMQVGVASRFRSAHGHCFLLGDAAHQFTPAGGFGMNTGIQDAHNLAWKLAVALRSRKNGQTDGADNLLASYETERRPVALKTAALSLKNYQKTLAVPRAMGLNPAYASTLSRWISHLPVSQSTRSKIFNQAMRIGLRQVDWLKTDNSFARYRRRALDAIFKDARNKTLQLLFPGNDFGNRYRHKISVEPQESPTTMNTALTYAPKLEIGGRAPHFWIEGYQDGPISILDLPSLIWRDRNTIDNILIVNGDIEWAVAALTQGAYKPLIDDQVVTIGSELDPECKSSFKFKNTKPAFLPARFAMLMRPDGYIDWLTTDDGNGV